jgi:membrane protein involved in colicin uptake
MMNKKGQNSTIAVTIAIVLGVALIVFLIWGFATNWKIFGGTTDSYLGDQIVIAKDACTYQCESGLKSQYCDGKKTDEKMNCTNAKLLGPGGCPSIKC